MSPLPIVVVDAVAVAVVRRSMAIQALLTFIAAVAARRCLVAMIGD
jgi:hypothetical protein